MEVGRHQRSPANPATGTKSGRAAAAVEVAVTPVWSLLKPIMIGLTSKLALVTCKWCLKCICSNVIATISTPWCRVGWGRWDVTLPWHLQSKNGTQTLAHVPVEQRVGWGGMLTFPTSQRENQIKDNR